ncbi:HAD family hydrolase [Variovorax sp. RHLX14]|uniref:HAD family hydrolase n=1 Tax=Variovorax sp. RHLX14 TaxID=1259731 RepID=UPI003F46D8D3
MAEGLEQRGHQLAPGEVAGAAEQNEVEAHECRSVGCGCIGALLSHAGSVPSGAHETIAALSATDLHAMNIVFDLGAVLIAWEPAQLVQAHFPERTPTAEAASALARAFFHHKDWLDFDCGIRTVDEVVARTSTRLALPADRVSDMIVPLGERLQPIPESVELLAELFACRNQRHDVRIFYLSNMPQPYARALERRLSFFSNFDGGIFSADVKLTKPHGEIYELLALRYSLAPEETLFIDDTAANVEAARAMGWHAIHCTQPKLLKTQIARYLQPMKAPSGDGLSAPW